MIQNAANALTLNNIYVQQNANGTNTVTATTNGANITLAGRITGDGNAAANYGSTNGASTAEGSNTYLQSVALQTGGAAGQILGANGDNLLKAQRFTLQAKGAEGSGGVGSSTQAINLDWRNATVSNQNSLAVSL